MDQPSLDLPIRTLIKLYKNKKPLAVNKIFSQTLGKSAFIDNDWCDAHYVPTKFQGTGAEINVKGSRTTVLIPGIDQYTKAGDSITLDNCTPTNMLNTLSGVVTVSNNNGSYRVLSVNPGCLEILNPKAQPERFNQSISWQINGLENGDPRPMHEEFWLVDIIRETCKGENRGCFVVSPVRQVNPVDCNRLLPGMYDEYIVQGCQYIVPKAENRKELWILPLKSKQSVNTKYYASIVVL